MSVQPILLIVMRMQLTIILLDLSNAIVNMDLVEMERIVKVLKQY